MVTRAEEQQQPCVRLFFLLVSQRMTFIHIHPDSMDPWVGGKRGRGRIEGVDGEVSFLSTSSVALKWMLLLFRGRRIFFFFVLRWTRRGGGRIELGKVHLMRTRRLARWGETCRGRTRREGELTDLFPVRRRQKSPRLKYIYARRVGALLPHKSCLTDCEKKQNKGKKKNVLPCLHRRAMFLKP